MDNSARYTENEVFIERVAPTGTCPRCGGYNTKGHEGSFFCHVWGARHAYAKSEDHEKGRLSKHVGWILRGVPEVPVREPSESKESGKPDG
jgi:uncharacterized Zn finger protein (UPF0148 family)